RAGNTLTPSGPKFQPIRWSSRRVASSRSLRSGRLMRYASAKPSKTRFVEFTLHLYRPVGAPSASFSNRVATHPDQTEILVKLPAQKPRLTFTLPRIVATCTDEDCYYFERACR